MRITLLGKRWNLLFAPPEKGNRGDIDPPHTRGKTIRICPKLQDLAELDTLVHELLHAADWHRDEEWIETVATDISRVLWKLNYRRQDA